MSQDYAVQSRRPAALPYAITGAGIGALGGLIASKKDFAQVAKYSSWKDVLKDSKDDFKRMADAAGESETLKQGVQAAKNAYNNFTATIKSLVEHSDVYKNLAEYQPVINARKAAKDAFERLVKEAEGGKLGFNVAGKSGEELTKAAKEYVQKLIKSGDEKVKSVTDAITDLKEKSLALTKQVKEGKVQVFKDTIENNKNKAKEAFTKAWDAVKDKVKDFKVSKTSKWVAGAATVGLLLGLLVRPKAKEQ